MARAASNPFGASPPLSMVLAAWTSLGSPESSSCVTHFVGIENADPDPTPVVGTVKRANGAHADDSAWLGPPATRREGRHKPPAFASPNSGIIQARAAETPGSLRPRTQASRPPLRGVLIRSTTRMVFGWCTTKPRVTIASSAMPRRLKKDQRSFTAAATRKP
jgi:hypothetical protein